MKLKWYDWDGVGEIPSGVVGVKKGSGRVEMGKSKFNELPELWSRSPLTTYQNDIIAYTLGEPLEVDEVAAELTRRIEEDGAIFDVVEAGEASVNDVIPHEQYGEPLEGDK